MTTRLIPLLIGGLMFMSSVSSSPSHNHTQAGTSQGTRCQFPSLQCAKAPSAAFDPHGRLWVVWAFGGHVYLHYSDNLGQSYSPPVAVNREPETISARGENRPKIAFDRHQGIYLSWTRSASKRYSGHIRFSHSDDGGESFSSPITVNDHLEDVGHRFDALRVTPQGDVYIAWIDKRDRHARQAAGEKYAGAALYYAWRPAGETRFRPNLKVADHSCECCRLGMALDVDQKPVIVWRHIFGDNIRDHALTRFTAHETFTPPQRATYDGWKIAACPHHGPDLRVENGVYHLAWFSDSPTAQGLFYAQSADQGQHFSSPYPFGKVNHRASRPQVLAIGNTVYLAWKTFDGQQHQIRQQRSIDGGQQWQAVQVVAEAEGQVDYPQLLTHQNQPYLFWFTKKHGFLLHNIGVNP
jgi:hypothetical protein